MKFAFSTNAYRQHSLEESIASIKNAGYSALEIMCDTPHAYPPLTDERILVMVILDLFCAISNFYS